LVIDQTFGDASVELGQADATSFSRMITVALARHPSCKLLVKIHPEVMAGLKKGYINTVDINNQGRIDLLTANVHPARLIEQADAVYTVTSQIGFEALLWGRVVYTFGMPFYAGWGLTIDELAPPARRQAISLEQLVHAALIDYPCYLHPETHQRTEAEELIQWIGLQRQHRARFAETIYALGFSYYKRSSVSRFLEGSKVVFTNNLKAIPTTSTVAVWGSQNLARSDLNIIRLEDGFIRSIGLGADLIKPSSWVADSTGIYYDATQPSDLETLLLNSQPNYVKLERARRLRQRIIEAGLSKYNLPGDRWRRPPHTKKVILVPGQVESDASLAFGAPKIKRNIDLLKAVRTANPRAYILYKPHPDVVAKLRRQGSGEDRANVYCNEIISHASIHDLISAVDEVHVMTSLTGFEALLRNRKVVTYGLPFYAGWGLTKDHLHHPRRNRELTLDQLVAGVLIEYASYRRSDINGFASPEAALTGLVTTQQQLKPFKNIRRATRRFVALASSKRD
jgi:capsular polysaccharide export protein